MQSPEKLLINRATVIAIAAFTLLAFFSVVIFYQQTRANATAKGLVVHTYEVTGHIQLLFNRIKDVSLGERAYLITGDEKYLEPYHDALKNSLGADAKSERFEQHHSIAEELAILRNLTSDNPRQQQNLEELTRYFQELRANWAQIPELRALQTTDNAAFKVRFDKITQLMDQLRRLVSIIMAEENNLLATRIESAKQGEKQNEFFIFSFIGIFYLIMVVSIWVYQRSRERELIRRRQVEKNLRETTGFQRTILESALYPILVTDKHKTICIFNPAAQRMLGYSTEQVLGKLTPSAFHLPEELADYAQTLSSELGETVLPSDTYGKKAYTSGSEEHEWTFLRYDNVRISVLSTTTVLYDEQRNIQGYLSIYKDITERKQMEKMKNEFISIVSHELRTPLTSIRGSLGLIAGTMKKDLPEKTNRLIEIAHKSSERLILLINDILDIDKIATGQMRFNMQEENLCMIVQQAVEANRSYGEKFKVRFVFDTPASIVPIKVDADRLTQVLSNLLSNAAKFSPEDSLVEVRIVCLNGSARVEIEDHGPGIPNEFRAHIFRKFSQADSSITRKKGGSGLGLHISRDIIERMGGQIGFETDIGKGSTFWISVPEITVHSIKSLSEKILSSTGGIHHARVLVCEDDQDVGHLIKIMLEHSGFMVDTVEDIPSAKQMLKNNSYDALTLDIILPSGNGLDFMRELRTTPATLNLPIVVVSAYALEGKKALNGDAIGIVDWIIKPIDEQRLIRSLNLATHRTHGVLPRVLHVEDDLDLVNVLATALHGQAELVLATTLQQAETRLREERFSLIVLDMTLPDGTGLSLLEHINELVSVPPPILILSATEDTQEMEKRVAAIMVKSRMSETRIVETILNLINAASPPSKEPSHVP